MRPSSAKRRLVVLDIDGTLLTSSGVILRSTRRAMAALIDRGHLVALASARPPNSVKTIADSLLGSNAAALISLNGALNMRGDAILYERTIGAPAIDAIVETAIARGLEVSLFTRSEWFVESIGEGVLAEAEILGFGPTIIADFGVAPSVHKVLLIGSSDATAGLRDWANQSRHGISAALSKATYCEITSARTSKAAAIGVLAQEYGIDISDVIAFGDGDNDLAMMARAGIGVAMGNGTPALKHAANLVTSSNDTDGIARALGRLGLIDPF